MLSISGGEGEGDSRTTASQLMRLALSAGPASCEKMRLWSAPGVTVGKQQEAFFSFLFFSSSFREHLLDNHYDGTNLALMRMEDSGKVWPICAHIL